jgi:hypothetical protein
MLLAQRPHLFALDPTLDVSQYAHKAFTSSGVGRLVGGRIEAYRLPGNAQQFHGRRLFRDRDGALWIGTPDRGMVHVHDGRIDVFGPSSGFSGGAVNALFEDREGNIWVAATNGLDRFREFAIPTYNQNQGLLNSNVGTTLADKDGSVWLGTYDGLNKWSDGQFSVYRDQSVMGASATAKQNWKIRGSVPYPMLQDSRGRVWIKTRREFGYIDDNRFTPARAVPGWAVLSVAEDCDLVPLVRDEAYRITGEALRNAFQHAHAKRIEVEIRYDQRQLRLRVRDNGKGIDPKVLGEGGRVGHYGLPGMHERAKLVGGKLAVWSEVDSGTETELTISASIAYAKSLATRRLMFWRKGA